MSARCRPNLRLLMSLLLLAFPATAIAQAVEHDVIIIGAGAAGQYAAYELNYLGFDVLVLEARPRRHGMLHPPQTIGTTEVHTIAESVTGNNEVNWHYQDIADLDPNRLIRKYPWSASDDTLYSVHGSTVLGTDVTRRNNPEIYDYWDFWDEQWTYRGPDVDVEAYLCDTLDVCRGDADFHLYRSGFPGSDWLTRLDQIGMRSLAEMESLWDLSGGPQVFAYSSWTDTLDELYFNEIVDKVQLNHTVTDVDTSGAVAVVTAVDAKCSNCHAQPGPDRGVPIPVTGDHPRVTVTANAVVSTLPVGVLKAGDVTFTPPLPASKLWALDHLGVGNGGKMFLQFSSRVWPTTTNILLTEGVAGYCWDYEYRGGDGGAVMTCYTVGENADALDAMGSDAARLAAVVADLDTMYPGTPFSDAFVTGFWKRMDDMLHSKGGYTYPKPGSYPTDGSPSAREVLAEPVGTALYFAGAPTHNSWASTVVGAMDSGLRAAGEIDADHDPVPEPTPTATPTAMPTPTVTPTPTATPTPSPEKECRCVPTGVSPINNLATLRQTTTGGSRSTQTKNVTVSLKARERTRGACRSGMDALSVRLRMVDDDGDVILDETRTGLTCNRRIRRQKFMATYDIENCAGSAPPERNSAGEVTVTATTEDGELIASRTLKCRK